MHRDDTGRVRTNLVRYIEAGAIRPLVSATYALAEIAQAQADFLEQGADRQDRARALTWSIRCATRSTCESCRR